ncbi:FAD-dependent oxidoreductase [uncultured Fibrobacter sp.]|uniref:FAD-dependent oxidoreductase n=1 Tax=uncultured Fibrobacter sp. TaxID=261512 RepID=UPI0025E7D248|nr:FAD-dependent oxidoreductase [uncultured Fibrobacter sp.]MCI5486003.1 FAD-dependent oxidoreductase [Clostridiales bacterium]
MKVVIVGGVAGGATAAARIRRLDEQAEIVVFERSGYISYANCGLPYYIGDVITDPEELTLQTPESFFSRFRVDMKVRHEVTAIHPERKTVSVKNLETDEVFEESYDKLILSPGAKPTQPRLPGVGIDKLFTLRTVEDTFRIKEYINQNHPKSAVLAGGGFIGLELAENLRELGMDVTIVQRPKQLMNPFDADMASMIHSEMRKHGVKLALGYTVEGFEERNGGVDVLLKDNAPLHADMVVLAIGVTPDTALAREAGLELGIKGSIVVNDRMETSVPDIYAAGDAVQVKHYVTGEDALISLAGPANKQGRIIADNICGGDSRYLGSQGSSVIKVFDMTAATTGINETNARKAGLDVDTVILSPMSHAGYYPGGKVMTMKVVFEKGTYRLLGAQIVGYDGVDKRIDVLATAIHAGLKATQLKDLDLAYAPPYSSAKDPVNMAGFMIDNISKGLKQWHLHDADKLPRDGSVILLDTRTAREYSSGHIEGFVNIPVDELRERLDEIEPGKPVYVICQSGLRSYIATRILEGYGYEAYNFAGGFRFYDAVVNDRALIEKAYSCGMDK